jgi:hygromycin-B 4-O-kinase
MVSTEEVANFLGQHLEIPVKLTPLAHGQESRAWRFRLEDKAYVVRVNSSRDGFDKDRFASRRFGSAVLPIPEIIEIGSLDHGCAFCISICAAGVTLQDLGRQDLQASLGATQMVMEAMAKTDISSTSGFGSFNASGVAPFASWAGYLSSISDGHRYDWNAVTDSVPSCNIGELLATSTALAKCCPETRQLVHGDFGSNNVLINDNRITGIIDWSEAMFGDPLYDLANVFFWRTWLLCMEELAAFWEDRLPFGAKTRERLLCYQLHIGLRELYGRARSGDLSGALWAAERTRDIQNTFVL